jgi:hypothetical protein
MQEVPVEHRGDAVSSLVYEANARMRDPIYGCVGAITALQRQVESLQTQLALAQAEMIRIRMAGACTAARRNGSSSSGGGSPSSMSSPAKTAEQDWKPTPDFRVAVDQQNVMELEYARFWSY